MITSLAVGVAAIAATPTRGRLIVAVAVGVAGLVALHFAGARDGHLAVSQQASPGVASDPVTTQEMDGLGERGSQRRMLLKTLGVGALGAIPVMFAPAVTDRLIRNLVGGEGPHGEGAMAMGSRAPATGRDGRIRQWSMIIDLRYCDGCQSRGTPPQCTLACIEGHFAPEPMQWIEVYEGELEGGGTQFIPTPCQHCQNPPCVNVCPVGATFSTPEGTVLIDQNRCIGCRICMAACPLRPAVLQLGGSPGSSGIAPRRSLGGASSAGAAGNGHEVRLLPGHGAGGNPPVLHPGMSQ